MSTRSSADNSVLDVLPVSAQNSALVQKNEDGTRITNLTEFSNFNEPSCLPATVNIENSSEIILGPLKQVNGPVTIYQKENLAKSDSTDARNRSLTKLPVSKRLVYIGIVLTLYLVALVTTTTILVNNSTNYVMKKSDDQYDYIHDGGDILKPFGPGAIMDRKLWGGRPPFFSNRTFLLPHPVPLVIISHTVTETCKTFVTCSKIVKYMQNEHFDTHGSPDVGYNFIIGGDGNAYIGRGWDITNFHQNETIGISFIGNYIYDFLTEDMIEIAKRLLAEGVAKGKLATDYKLVAHNQTDNTLSPGPHIFEVITTWYHYDPTIYYP